MKIKLHQYCERKRSTANKWTTPLHRFGAKIVTAKEILGLGAREIPRGLDLQVNCSLGR